jgi:hypothetical protein
VVRPGSSRSAFLHQRRDPGRAPEELPDSFVPITLGLIRGSTSFVCMPGVSRLVQARVCREDPGQTPNVAAVLRNVVLRFPQDLLVKLSRTHKVTHPSLWSVRGLLPAASFIQWERPRACTWRLPGTPGFNNPAYIKRLPLLPCRKIRPTSSALVIFS